MILSLAIGNGPSVKESLVSKLQAAGDQIGDPIEISTLRREDFKTNNAITEVEEIVQCNLLPSSRSARGHQCKYCVHILNILFCLITTS